MPKLYHSPHSRSSRVISQLMLMGKLDAVEVIYVDIIKNDGSGRRDPMNAHPEGKVPYLVTDAGETIRESGAIMMYLDELFGQPLSPKIGDAKRGSYLSWMVYSGGVLEPVLVADFAGFEHPALIATFRGKAEMGATLETALKQGPFLLGEGLTLADVLLASPFQWAPQFMPDIPEVKAWVERVSAAMDGAAVQAYDAKAMELLRADA